MWRSRLLISVSILAAVVSAAAIVLMRWPASTHAVQPSALGTSSGTAALSAVMDKPGPLVVETVASCDWQVPRSGVINLNHPKSKEAGLKDGVEPIQIFFHVIRHPEKGTFIVDTGVEKALRDDPEHAEIRGMAASAFHTDRMKFHVPLADFLKKEPKPISGIFLTHAHVDHVSGMPDVPHGTPIYAGPGETSAQGAMNVVAQPLTDRLLAGQSPISEWQFRTDPDGKFEGVLDVFGDGSLWAIWVPGHTPGSTAYLARTAQGPVLMTGDTSHTAWGWDNGVEPGSYTGDQGQNATSLKQLRALVADHPAVSLRFGHQLPQGGSAAASAP